MIKKYMRITAFLMTLFLIGCGGSKGCDFASIAFGKSVGDACSSGSAGVNGSPTSYTSVANIGELVDWQINWNASPPTYSYLILSSAYGLEGQTNNGTLFLNDDGTYTPSNIPDGRVFLSPSGLLLAQIYVKRPDKNSHELIDVVGIALSSMVEVNALEGNVYNYIGSNCASGSSCKSSYGTLKFSSDRWELCPGANNQNTNIGLTAQCSGGLVGFYSRLNQSEIYDLKDSKNLIAGKIIAPNSSSVSKNMVIIDLNGRSNLVGAGSIYAVKQAAVSMDALSGSWLHRNASGDFYRTILTGQSASSYAITPSGCYYGTDAKISNFTDNVNVPWSGFVTNGYGDVVLASETNLFAAYAQTSVLPILGLRSSLNTIDSIARCVPAGFSGAWSGTVTNSGRNDPALILVSASGDIWGVSSYYGSIPSLLGKGSLAVSGNDVYAYFVSNDFTRGAQIGRLNISASYISNSSSVTFDIGGSSSVFNSVANRTISDISLVSGTYTFSSGSSIPGIASLSSSAIVNNSSLILNFNNGCSGSGRISPGGMIDGSFNVSVNFNSRSLTCPIDGSLDYKGVMIILSGEGGKQIYLMLNDANGIPAFAAIGKSPS